MFQPAEVEARIEESQRVKQALRSQSSLIARMAECLTRCLQDGRTVFFFGNGGSAADAQHMACELAGRFYLERASLPALALTVNTSSLTAIGNDFGFEQVFARQLEGMGRDGDAAVAISTSGSSPNVLRGVEVARKRGMATLGLTGRTGGALKDLVELCLLVDSDETPRIQEAHILAGHIICELVERELFRGGA
ncbi:MAG: SIS domain-containing protein [Candidatus Eisenbacteria bacterium]|nr:SIS domain-containing protein [Candidatus Eisenbacteria bacterium]